MFFDISKCNIGFLGWYSGMSLVGSTVEYSTLIIPTCLKWPWYTSLQIWRHLHHRQLHGSGLETCPSSDLILKLLISSTSGRTPWTEDYSYARPLPTQDNTTYKYADKHPCLKWIRTHDPRVLFRINSLSLHARKKYSDVRFQVLTAASMMFRGVFWDILPSRQYAPLKRRSTIILHGSISQKTTLNKI
jgi:hypothetical protein